MSGPRTHLLERFGTLAFYEDSLEKRASAGMLLRVLGPAGTAAMMSSMSSSQDRQVQEAQIINRMFRELEARKQRGVVGGLSGEMPAMSVQGQAAQQLNQMEGYQRMMSLMNKRAGVLTHAAREAVESMDKEAFGALMAGASKLIGNAGLKTKGITNALKTPKAVAPRAPGLGGTQGVAQAAQARKPIIGMKAKLLAGGAALGAGYAGYKGLQTAKDYMMQPTYATQAWGGSGTLRGGVNEFGYSNPF
jgi:hypothetical protein